MLTLYAVYIRNSQYIIEKCTVICGNQMVGGCITCESTVGGSCSGSPTSISLEQPYCSGISVSNSTAWVACNMGRKQYV